MVSYALLCAAIACEVTGTLALRQSAGFSRIWPGAVAIVSYAIAFTLLAMVLNRGMSVAVAYAIWSAAGILLLAIIGALVLGETLSSLQLIGIAVLVAGIVLLEVGTATRA